MSPKYLNISLHEKSKSHSLSVFFRQKFAKFTEHISSNVSGNRLSLESGPEFGYLFSVSEHVMTKQDRTKVELVKAWIVSSSLAKFPTVSMWKLYASFLIFSSWLLGSSLVFGD